MIKEIRRTIKKRIVILNLLTEDEKVKEYIIKNFVTETNRLGYRLVGDVTMTEENFETGARYIYGRFYYVGKKKALILPPLPKTMVNIEQRYLLNDQRFGFHHNPYAQARNAGKLL